MSGDVTPEELAYGRRLIGWWNSLTCDQHGELLDAMSDQDVATGIRWARSEGIPEFVGVATMALVLAVHS